MGWKADRLVGSTVDVGAAWLRLHSSESQFEWDDVVELALDACEVASENTDEVEEEAEEERGAAYGWVSGKKPCLGRGMSRLMLK
jgi:hypothetical protein